MGYFNTWVELAIETKPKDKELTTEQIIVAKDELVRLNHLVEYTPLVEDVSKDFFTRDRYEKQIPQQVIELRNKRNVPDELTEEEDTIIDEWYAYEANTFKGYQYQYTNPFIFQSYIDKILELSEGFEDVTVSITTTHTSNEESQWNITFRNNTVLYERWGVNREEEVNYSMIDHTEDPELVKHIKKVDGELVTTTQSKTDYEEETKKQIISNQETKEGKRYEEAKQ